MEKFSYKYENPTKAEIYPIRLLREVMQISILKKWLKSL